MSTQSTIEWTDTTWNPVRGCSVISPGCVNCYAMKQAHRFSGPGRAYEGLTKLTKAGPQWTGKVVTVEDALLEPLSWRKPRRVFVNSMSDLFHEDVPFEFIDRVLAVMALAPRHTFQVLTKRAHRMVMYLTTGNRSELVAREICSVSASLKRPYTWEEARSIIFGLKLSDETPPTSRWPLPNVWLGVSVEDQKHADERIPLLLQTPAAVRFISAEPLLGPVDLTHVREPSYYDRDALDVNRWQPPWTANAKLDWVIVGGESGPGARPCRVAWVRSTVAQCKAAGVAVFVKQLGAKPEGDPRPPERIDPATGARTLTVMQQIEIHDSKGGDPSEWPEDLRVRQFPETVTVDGANR
jgi:protein gp37